MKSLQELFLECKSQLNSVGIDVTKDCEIDIKLGRKTKRYGCCKPEMPDKTTKYITKIRGRTYIKYYRYKQYHIEISPWVMNLNEEIIKNTIIHELIHCLPGCDNHGKDFKKYAKFINEKLCYNITTAGNKAEDYKKSNLQLVENNEYNYKIQCKKCNQVFYRKRLVKGFEKKYICSRCGGKFLVENYPQKVI